MAKTLFIVLVAALLTLCATSAFAAESAGDVSAASGSAPAPDVSASSGRPNNGHDGDGDRDRRTRTVTSTVISAETKTTTLPGKKTTITDTKTVTSTQKSRPNRHTRTVTSTTTETKTVDRDRKCPPPKKCPHVPRPAPCPAPPAPEVCVIKPYLVGEVKLKIKVTKDSGIHISGTGDVAPLGQSTFEGKISIKDGRGSGEIKITGAQKTIVIYLNVALANPASPEGQWFYILTAGDSGVGNVHASLATHKRERGLTLKFGA